MRPASGYAAIPICFFALCSENEHLFFKYLSILLFVFVLLSGQYLSSVSNEMNRVSTTYLAKELADQGGNSTLSLFNSLPWGISHFVKLLYSLLHPFPAWKNLSASSNDTLFSQTYNATKFPDIWIVFFRMIAASIIINGLLYKNTREFIIKNKTFLYLLLYSFIILLMQTNSVEERRKIALYPLFFVLIASFYNTFPNTYKRNSVFAGAFIFFFLQSIALITLIVK